MRRWLTLFLIAATCMPARAETEPAPWLQVVRDTPYVYSAGLYDNLATIRRWVLRGEGYCAQAERHLLFDQRGNFLTWFDNAGDRGANQQQLNQVREELYRTGDVQRWIAGGAGETGYPFALRCDQPHVDLAAALDRLVGATEDDRVWGTWDGITAGSPEQPWSLLEVVLEVLHTQAERRGYEVTDAMQQAFLGQILIESGARKRSFSAAQAVGLLQLRPEVLADCELDERFHLHRMAQVDCAVRLYQQNDRNLRPAFEQRFGDLPEAKRERLYSLLLVQAYHGGIGRMLDLLGDGELGRAGRELAAEAERYSAEDLALGLVFHNLGRIDLGLDSLYYSVDVAIAAEAVCAARPQACS